MVVISIEKVAEILGLKKSRIEQWISRGQFLPRAINAQGKKREWDLSEVIRLGVFAKLANEVSLLPAKPRRLTPEELGRLTAEDAGRLTQSGVYSFVDDEAFFVCYKTDPDFGWFHEIVRKRDIGTFLSEGCFIPKVLASGYSEEARRYNSENDTGPATVAVIINLDHIEKQVKEGWPSGSEAA